MEINAQCVYVSACVQECWNVTQPHLMCAHSNGSECYTNICSVMMLLFGWKWHILGPRTIHIHTTSSERNSIQQEGKKRATECEWMSNSNNKKWSLCEITFIPDRLYCFVNYSFLLSAMPESVCYISDGVSLFFFFLLCRRIVITYVYMSCHSYFLVARINKRSFILSYSFCSVVLNGRTGS